MKKIPYVTKEKAEEIAQQFPTPFYLYDEKGIRDNAQAVKEAFAWNPGFREYFAVKATPNPYIMDIFREYGFGFDCSSMTELMLSNAVGASGHEIMFSSNDTPPEEYAYAAKLGADFLLGAQLGNINMLYKKFDIIILTQNFTEFFIIVGFLAADTVI